MRSSDITRRILLFPIALSVVAAACGERGDDPDRSAGIGGDGAAGTGGAAGGADINGTVGTSGAPSGALAGAGGNGGSASRGDLSGVIFFRDVHGGYKDWKILDARTGGVKVFSAKTAYLGPVDSADAIIETNVSTGELAWMDQQTGATTALLTCGDRPFDLDRRPAVSPDGKTVSFRMHGGSPARDAIESVPLDALRGLGAAPSGLAALMSVSGWREFSGYSDASWAPDGSLLLVTSATISEVRKGGMPTVTLQNLAAPTSPTVSADGSKIAFIQQGSQIYVANRDGSGLAKLTSSRLPFTSISYSPSGNMLVAANRTADVNGNEVNQVVFVTPDGSVTNQVTDNAGSPIYADVVLWLGK